MKSLVCIGLIASMVSLTSPVVTSSRNFNTSSRVPNNISSRIKIPSVKVESKKLVSNNALLSAELKIPVVKGLSNLKLQKQINSIFENDAIDFKNKVAKLAKEYNAKEVNLEFKNLPFQANTGYKVYNTDKNLLSLYIDYYEYTGGAHGLTTRKCYNIDLKTGRTLSLKDVLGKNTQYKEVINNVIKSEMKNKPEIYFESEFKGISDEQCFTIEGDNLVIHFQQYEIAPYSTGIPEFKIPLSKIVK